MRLELDCEQRLYLWLLLGNLECRTVGETRAAWQLMDRVNLDEAEKIAMSLKVQIVDGQEAFSWDQTVRATPRQFDISESEIQQLGRAIAGCPKFLPRHARRWLEPLLRQLPYLEESSNGNRPAANP